MRRWLNSLLCFILIFVALYAGVSAQDGSGVSAEAFRTVNVRQGPGTQFDVIGQLESGDVVPVIGRSDSENNWLLVQFGDAEGWVAFFTVTVTGNVTALDIINLQVVSEPQSPPVGGSLPFVSESEITTGDPHITAYRRINVRLGPGSAFGRLGYMNPGNVADITGISDDGEWIQIAFEGQIGWVAFFVVSVNGSLDQVPVIIIDRAPRTPVPTPTRTPAPLDIRLETSFNTNLRAEPDFNAPIIGTIPYSTQLQVEARTADSVWLRVTYQGQTGWVVTSLVELVYLYRGQRLEQLPVAG